MASFVLPPKAIHDSTIYLHCRKTGPFVTLFLSIKIYYESKLTKANDLALYA